MSVSVGKLYLCVCTHAATLVRKINVPCMLSRTWGAQEFAIKVKLSEILLKSPRARNLPAQCMGASDS